MQGLAGGIMSQFGLQQDLDVWSGQVGGDGGGGGGGGGGGKLEVGPFLRLL